MLSRVACMLSYIQLFASPWTLGYQAPLSMGFSRQEYWSGLPFLSPGDLRHPGITLMSPNISCIGRQVLYHCITGKALMLSWVHPYIPIKMYTLYIHYIYIIYRYCISAIFKIYSINLKRQWKKEKALTEQWSAYILTSHDMCLYQSPQCWPSFYSGITCSVQKKLKGNFQHCFKPRIQVVSRVCRALGNWHGRSFCFRYRMNRAKLTLFYGSRVYVCVCVC